MKSLLLTLETRAEPANDVPEVQSPVAVRELRSACAPGLAMPVQVLPAVCAQRFEPPVTANSAALKRRIRKRKHRTFKKVKADRGSEFLHFTVGRCPKLFDGNES